MTPDNTSMPIWLAVLVFFCPIIAIYVITNKKYDGLRNKKWLSVVFVIWLTVWFLALANIIYKPTIATENNRLVDTQTVVGDYNDEDIESIPTNEQAQNTEDEKQAEAEKTQEYSRAPATAPTQTPTPMQAPTPARTAMSGINIAEAQNVSYDRSKYQPNWSVGSGCDIRSRILSSTSLIAVTFGTNGCTVKYGSWKDPYTGQVLTGNPYQGDGAANDLDIDHIIPLNYVNSHGGYYWNDSQKRAYGASLTAMNNGVYLAVSASENRKKGDKGPASYYPPSPEYRCEYSIKWRDIARTYIISLSQADYNFIANVLASCGVSQ